jgi:hypothetical protein
MIRDDFLPIPDLGVKKAQDPGSGSATLEVNILFLFFFDLVISGSLCTAWESSDTYQKMTPSF